MLNIDIIPCLSDNYSYVIHDDSANTVGVVDPSEFTKIDNFISKKYKKIDYILNTHHHYDHVGGNFDLQKKYNSKIVGSKLDKEKILNIDILLKNNDFFKLGLTTFKIIHLPGHTKGHIAFYSVNDKIIFTGDTLFSLGCGKIFEGTYKEMFSSINKIKNLPADTKIYCGHEYTKKNAEFCLVYEKENKHLQKKISWINNMLTKGLPTIPFILEEEIKTNIFLRCNNIAIKNYLGMSHASEEEIFEKLRYLKDNF